MTTTAADIINAGMRKLRIIDSDSTADATQLTNGLLVLNTLLDSWNAEKITLYEEVELSALTLTGATSYTIGSGGALSTTRPEDFVSAFYRLNSVDYGPLKFITKKEWDHIQSKTSAGTPEVIWVDMAYPLAVMRLYPNPASGSLYLTVALQLTEFAASSTALALPPGYRKALIYNFAVDYSSEGGILTDEIKQNATLSLGAIKRRNAIKTSEVQLEVADLTDRLHGNILTG